MGVRTGRRASGARSRGRLAALLAGCVTLGLAMGLSSSLAMAAPAAPDEALQLDVFQGRLQAGKPGCTGAEDAVLISCEGAEQIWVKSVPGVDVNRFVGQLVSIEGRLRACGTNRYIDLNSISPLRRCGDPGVVPAPEKVNLALGRVDWANPEGPPQHWMGLAADGDPATSWAADSSVAYVRVNLGGKRTFNRMRLLWGERYAEQYGLYVWDEVESRWVRFYQRNNGTVDDEITVPRILGQFVLLQLARSNLPNDGYDLREWEISGIETPNLALGTQVQVSSRMPGFPGELAVDADEATAWVSEGGQAHPWIYVRFSAPMPLTEFRLLWHRQNKPAVFRVGFYQGGEVKVWSQPLTSTNERQRLAWITPIVSDAFYIYTESFETGRDRVALHDLQLFGDASVVSASALGSGLGEGLDGARMFGLR